MPLMKRPGRCRGKSYLISGLLGSVPLVGGEAVMALSAGYGEGMTLHGADALAVNITDSRRRHPRV